jgi:hypothetical protein
LLWLPIECNCKSALPFNLKTEVSIIIVVYQNCI